MRWNWTIAVERQHRALRWVVMVMFSTAGLVPGAVVEILPRHVHSAILRYLRPAEAAMRRLIVMAIRIEDASGLPFIWTLPVPKRRRKKSKRRAKGGGDGAVDPNFVPVFPLFDPRKDPDPKPKTTPGYGPRIWSFDGMDDPVHRPSVPMPDDPVSARRLCLRLLALNAALDDLPGQVRRLKRVLARASRKWPQPMRRGRPPGYRARGKDFIDDILSDCQTMALRALEPADTS